MTEQVVLSNGVVVRLRERPTNAADGAPTPARRETWHWEDALVNAIRRGMHNWAVYFGLLDDEH